MTWPARAKKVPLTQKERSERSAQKRKERGEVGYHLSVTKGVKALLANLMEIGGITEQGEALTLSVHHLHGLGQQRAARLMGRQILIGEDTGKRETIRFRARPGTQMVIADLMRWCDYERPGDLFEAVILRMVEIGKEEALPLLTPPRHEITVSEKVARKIGRLGREEAAKKDAADDAVWTETNPVLAGQLPLIGESNEG